MYCSIKLYPWRTPCSWYTYRILPLEARTGYLWV
jgi:hypothetical protein